MHPELEQAFSLEGRACVVTGAASGLGRQAAITFAQAGADIVAADVSADALAATAEEVEGVGRRCVARVVDVRDRDAVHELADVACHELGRVDVWANVAGILRYGLIAEMPETDVRAVVDVNLLGVFWGVGAAGRVMTKGGSIINVSSAGAEIGSATRSAYGMSKAGVNYITKSAAHEYGPQGVRVNSVAPGWTETPMVAHYFTDEAGHVDDEARARTLSTFAEHSALRITGRPTDIAYCMLYLASDASRFVTGQVMRPNGGIHMG